MSNVRATLVALCLGVAANTATAAILNFTASLSGSGEVPPVASPATGSAQISVNTTTHLLFVNLVFTGLIGGNAVAGHIHCCSALGTNVGVAVGFPNFPSATSGTYANQFDLTLLSTYTTSFVTNFGGGTVTGAEAALISGLLASRSYVNVHNATFPGGEIRGQTAVATAPEPGTLVLLGVALGIVGWRSRRLLPLNDSNVKA